MEQRVDTLEQDIRGELSALRTEMQLLRADLHAEMQLLRADMHRENTNTLKWSIGTSVALWMPTLTATIAILMAIFLRT